MPNIFRTLTNRTEESFSNAQGAIRGSLADDLPGFSNLNNIPSPSGNQVRQAKVANLRSATAVRNMVRFLLPETGLVEMYVNPQNIKYNDKKHIPSPTRTRGGFVIQYWGEELGTVSLSGTTGSSGVEGINVLYDVYRNEQVSMDALGLAVEASKNQTTNESIGDIASDIGDLFSTGGVGNAINSGIDSLFDKANSVIQTGSTDPATLRPTLASIALQTEMYWSGWVFRGFFTQMNVTESADKLGLFEYNMEFTVTQKRGLRLNFMPWHRSAVNGPSNSDPAFGPPYSFASLRDPIPSGNLTEQQKAEASRLKRMAQSIDQALQSYRPL